MSDLAAVVVNGETRLLAPGTTVVDVVALLVASPNGVAVAVNGEVVPRSSWASTAPGPGDRVEVLSVAPGG